MPPARIWTEAEDARLREIGGTMTAQRIAAEIGCCRQALIERERLLGIQRCVIKPRGQGPRPSRAKSYAPAPAITRDWFPLPAGHDVTWTAISREPWPKVG